MPSFLAPMPVFCTKGLLSCCCQGWWALGRAAPWTMATVWIQDTGMKKYFVSSPGNRLRFGICHSFVFTPWQLLKEDLQDENVGCGNLVTKNPENTEGDTSGQNRKPASKAKPFRRVQQSRKSTLRPGGKLRPILSTAFALHCKNVLIHNWITDIKRLLHLTGFHIQPWGGESKFGCIGLRSAD